jgi:hypothetical protein
MMQFEVIQNKFDALHRFFLTFPIVLNYWLPMLQSKLIFVKIHKRPGSGSAIRKNAGSGSALNQCGSATLHRRIERIL